MQNIMGFNFTECKLVILGRKTKVTEEEARKAGKRKVEVCKKIVVHVSY